MDKKTNNLSTCQLQTRQQNKTNNLSTRQPKTCQLKKDTSGGYCGGVPPLPIPNREVKPTCADGTAMQCGRVGSRLLSAGAPRIQCPRDSFFVLVLFPSFLSVKSPPVSFLPVPCRKPYFCQLLLGAVILFLSICEGKVSLPMLPSLPSASYPSRILMQKAWLLDADCNAT